MIRSCAASPTSSATTDVYEAYPPADAKILLRGQVLKGMKPTDAPADYKKKRATDKQEQGVNDPMMPVAWTRVYKNEAGKENRIFTTTMGAATDLQSEGTAPPGRQRRLLGPRPGRAREGGRGIRRRVQADDVRLQGLPSRAEAGRSRDRRSLAREAAETKAEAPAAAPKLQP